MNYAIQEERLSAAQKALEENRRQLTLLLRQQQ